MKKATLTLATALIIIGISAQQGTGLQFKFGYQSKLKNTNTSSLGFSGTLPTSYSLKSYTPYVKNQGNYGTCVSWAMGYCAMSTQYAIAMDLTNRNIITSMAFCPYFIHNNSKEVTDGCASGNFFEDAGKELTETGVKKFYLPLIGCATPNNDQMLTVAQNYRATDVTNLYAYTDLVSYDYTTYMQQFMKKSPFKVNEVKQALAGNKVVVFGMYLPPSFQAAYGLNLWEPDYNERKDPVGTLLDAQGQMHALHAMSIIGYDDTKYGGAFEIQNSWGSLWGDGGYIWIKYADLQRYVFQLMVIDMPAPALKSTTGCITGDCSNGYGIYKHANGEMYEGFFKNGNYNGYGIYAWSNGATYAGEWKDGARNGDAVIYYSDGTSGGAVYVADAFQSGFQKYSYEAGGSFEGNMKDGEFNGFGSLKFANGDWYQGVFTDNNYNGLGKYVFANGSYYIGYFADGKRNGRGIFVGNDGKIWGGNWSYDQFSSGKTYGFANSNSIDLGNIQIGANTNYVDANCTSGDCLNGKGTRAYSGSTYEGEFKDGVENGMGKTTYASGASQETFYASGTPIGVAVIKYTDGTTLIGPIKNGNIDGYIVYFDNAGGAIIGTYKNGTYVGKLPSANTADFNATKMGTPSSSGFKSIPVTPPVK